jgi:hypothetical protein
MIPSHYRILVVDDDEGFAHRLSDWNQNSTPGAICAPEALLRRMR